MAWKPILFGKKFPGYVDFRTGHDNGITRAAAGEQLSLSCERLLSSQLIVNIKVKISAPFMRIYRFSIERK